MGGEGTGEAGGISRGECRGLSPILRLMAEPWKRVTSEAGQLLETSCKAPSISWGVDFLGREGKALVPLVETTLETDSAGPGLSDSGTLDEGPAVLLERAFRGILMRT